MNDADTFEDIPLPKQTITCETVKSDLLDQESANILVTEPSSSLNIDVEIFDRIANKLLKSGLTLTALELHAELFERGKELPRLREYFDDAKNFEKCNTKNLEKCNTKTSSNVKRQELSNSLLAPRSLTPHTSSEHTFDSFDFTHYSDEDIERQGDERIAVLEFELRKAHQTINSLRACLTKSQTGLGVDVTDGLATTTTGHTSASELIVSSSPLCEVMTSFMSHSQQAPMSRDFYQRGSGDGDSCAGEEDKLKLTQQALTDSVSMFSHGQDSASLKYSLAWSIKPVEKRGINYLINEYLLANSYKLTSNTFCDEDASQDFDKWDDVGLNIDRPPDLLKMYRHYWNTHGGLMRTLSNATTVVNQSND